jgi:hypothetical protein
MTILSTRHQPLLSGFSLCSKFCLRTDLALLVDERHKRNTHDDCSTEKNQIDRSRVVVEDLVGERIEPGLREVEETSEADNEPVDFSKRCEAKDFC